MATDALTKGIAEYRARHYAESRDLFQAALRARASDTRVIRLLAMSELQLGNVEKSLALIRQAIALAPDELPHRFVLGAALLQAGKFDEAATVFGAVVAQKPDIEDAFRGLVQALVQLTTRQVAAGADVAVLPRLPDPGLVADPRRISAVVCSVDDNKRSLIQEQYHRLLGARCAEIVVIPDAKSLCEGFNRGLDRTTGDLVIFSHDDIKILTEDLAPRLLRHLADRHLVGVVGTSRLMGAVWNRAGYPHVHGCIVHRKRNGDEFLVECYGPPSHGKAIQAFDGVFIAAHREVCAALPFDEKTFDGFHVYDTDFSFRAFKAGFRSAICDDILIIHDFGGSFDERWKRYAVRFRDKHGIPKPAVPPRPWPSLTLRSEAEVRDFHARFTRILKR